MVIIKKQIVSINRYKGVGINMEWLSVNTINPKEGETIMVTVDRHLNRRDAEGISAFLNERFPNNKNIILEKATSILMAKEDLSA